ncbi:uncharacterized protein LOC120347205 [Styela clava]
MKNWKKSVLWTFLLIIQLHLSLGYDTFCGGEMEGSYGKVKIRNGEQKPIYFFTKRENLSKNCVFYQTLDEGLHSPAFLRIILPKLSLEDDAIQIRARRQRRGSKWETLNTFSNIQTYSKMNVSIDAIKYPFVKLLIPRNLTLIEPIEYRRVYPINLYNGSLVRHPLLRYCGLHRGFVDVIHCNLTAEKIACTFRCKKSHFPLFIDSDLYPKFIGICRKNGTVNWPTRSKPVCVSEGEIERGCFPKSEELYDCNYRDEAILRWYGEHNRTSTFSGQSSLYQRRSIECTQPESMQIAVEKPSASTCSDECIAKKVNGIWKFLPVCGERPSVRHCMGCRHPKKSSVCFSMMGFGG